MKGIKRVLTIVLIIIIVLAIVIFSFRIFNDHKYSEENVEILSYMENPTDISLYPTEIEGLKVQYISENTLQGFHLVPTDKKYNGVIVCYGGSEGSPNFIMAESLAREGYETLAVFMYGMENQPKTLVRIPLEQFEDVLHYINTNIEDKEPITVVAASKGAEYALNLATKYPEISNLILTAPSAYNFAGLDFNNYGSSWTWGGEELPYIDIMKSDFSVYLKNLLLPMITKSSISYKETYDTAIAQDPNSEEKLIPVEETDANIMLIVGKEDQMWNSLEMAKLIKRQGADNIVIHAYDGAGHIFNGDGVLEMSDLRIETGGSIEANERANIESIKEINKFLDLYHRR